MSSLCPSPSSHPLVRSLSKTGEASHYRVDTSQDQWLEVSTLCRNRTTAGINTEVLLCRCEASMYLYEVLAIFSYGIHLWAGRLEVPVRCCISQTLRLVPNLMLLIFRRGTICE